MKKIKRLFWIILSIVAVTAAMQVKIGYDQYALALETRPLNTVISELKSKANYTTYENIPKTYFDAVVAIEDRRFYLHRGFDIIGTARALYTDIKEREMVEGGSTLTQQLAKNLYFSQDNTLHRKIAEIFMAREIEKQYEKEEILEFYANGIYYGSGYYSIYDASTGYFGKAPIDMTAYECTMLAGIINAPSVYSLDANPDLARQRQEKVIAAMVDCGYIENENEILTN